MTRHPTELLDADGEGIYVLADPGGPPNCYRHAAHIFGVYWRDLEAVAVAMLPNDDDTYRRVSFKSWRWVLPARWRPACYLYFWPRP